MRSGERKTLRLGLLPRKSRVNAFLGRLPPRERQRLADALAEIRSGNRQVLAGEPDPKYWFLAFVGRFQVEISLEPGYETNDDGEIHARRGFVRRIFEPDFPL